MRLDSVMDRMLYRLVAAAIFAGLCSGFVHARPAGHFGFGQPPGYLEATERLGPFLVGAAHVDESLRSMMALTLPRAGCLDRGPIRRAVCGYQLCGSFRGGTAREFWITQGHGVWDLGPSRNCPLVLTPASSWRGDPV